jgi:carbon-monoxide dehydrogenase large subunit
MTTYRGQGLPRFEDDRLLRGQGQFIDDIQLPGMLHAAVLRSPEAHALITSVSTSNAESAPGVVAVFTGPSLAGKIPDIGAIRREGMGETPVPEHPVLARDRVCYVGQPVAVVVAQTLYEAYDAVELVTVEYQPLETLTDPRESARDIKPLHEEIGTNVVMRTAAGAGDVAEAFEVADEIVKASYEVPRLVATPMECRGIVAKHDDTDGRLTVWTSTQVAHRVKSFLGRLLPQKPDVRVVTPDVGGGFGRKIDVWPEEVVVAYAAIELGAPVKWIEQRTEHMVASHGRGFTADVEAAVRNDGSILGLRIRMVADLGAYFLTSTAGPLGNAVQRVAGPYAIPAMDIECLGVTTNRPPTGPYRGAGGPEAAVPIERIMDKAARTLGLDPAEIRRRNFIGTDAFPYTTATGLTYDSGDFDPAFQRAMELVDYQAVRSRQANEVGPIRTGIGVATVIKASGGKANIRKGLARVEATPDGHVTVFTDVSPHGQGTATSFAQITADTLGIDPEDVDVRHGDTDELASGGGTTSSRGLAVGGNAAYAALLEMRETLMARAADRLKCASSDITVAGHGVLTGPRDGSVSFGSLIPPSGLSIEGTFELPANPFAFAAHVAVIELDTGTGDVRLVDYSAVHDCGPMINPTIVRGQIQGGIVQGIGQALSEAMFYTDEGQPLTGSLMTYGIPTAESVPSFRLENQQTPSPTNPLGIKGIGETPTVAAPVAVANAVMDALAHADAGAAAVDMPMLPERVWQAAR